MTHPESDFKLAGGESEPRSPCQGVCRLDRAGAFCTACLRSLDEIAGWSRFTGREKRAILETLVERRSALPS